MNMIIETEAQQVAGTETQQAAAMLSLAMAYEIDSPEMAESAAQDLGEIKGRQKKLDEIRKGMTKPLDEAKARIMDLFRGPTETLQKAESQLKIAIGGWTEKERARIEAERRAQEEAARKLAEEQRRIAEEAAAKAKAAEAAGDHVAAIAAEQEAAAATQTAEVITHMAPAVVAAAPKLAGISNSDNWKCECTDLMALVKAVAEGKASIELVEFNQKEANKRAKALRAEFKVPGVRVYAEQVVSARARA
jgi:predicted phage tail protein